MNLHVAVDAHNLVRDWRGIGRYLRAILRRLVTRDDLRLTLLVRDALPFLAKPNLASILGASSFEVAHVVPAGADVVWHPWNGTFFKSSRPAVVTFHDAVPFAFPSADPAKRAGEQEPFRRSASTATRFLANSHFTAIEVSRFLGVDAGTIDVALLGVEPEFSPGNAVLPRVAGLRALGDRRYILYSGAIEPRKNVATLVAAHAAAFPNRDVALVCAGGNPPACENVLATGPLDAPQMIALYRGACAVAVPSLYEGFGFPLLEAMACGRPVVATCGSSLAEIGGDAAYWVADGRSVAAWSSALRAITDDGPVAAELAARGLAQARRFTWESTTGATLATLRRTAGTMVAA